MKSFFPTQVWIGNSRLVADVVRRHGVPIWFSETNMIGAQQWHDEIGAALRRCDWMLILLSPNSVDSMWVQREVIFSLNDLRYNEQIVPVLYQPCDYAELSWTLPALQIVDFTQGFEEGCRALLRVWGIGYRPPE